MSKLSLLYLVNSKLGVPGNVGFRIEKVLQGMISQGQNVVSFSRKTPSSLDKTHHLDMGFLSELPRVLNGIRIYLWPKLRSRYLDYLLFAQIEKKNEPRLQTLIGNFGVVHLAEVNPEICMSWQSRDFKVLLDMPIAPQAYVARLLRENGPIEGLDCDDFLSEREIESFRAADLILSPSSFVAEEIKKLGVKPEKIRVVPFGVDLNRPNRFEDKDFSQGIDFCFAGVGNFRKGLHILLEAWRDPVFVNDRLHLCGRMTPAVLKLIKQYNLTNVYCPGFVSTKDYFKNCDVFVFPSLMEGSAKAIYEAMASGLPVVTTYSSGSVVRDGESGFIVPILDVEKLKERLLYFKNQPHQIKVMGQAARQQVANMTWSDYAERVRACYLELAGGPAV